MTANELRVGNFVKVNGIIRECSYVSLKVITTKEDYPICFGIKEIEPIPLTKKWFEKFGFKMRIAPDGFIRRFPDELSSYEYQYTKEGIIISEYHFQGQQIRYEFIYPNSDPSIYSTLKLDYVHQLQNLFFDLKGEELTVKKNRLYTKSDFIRDNPSANLENMANEFRNAYDLNFVGGFKRK